MFETLLMTLFCKITQQARASIPQINANAPNICVLLVQFNDTIQYQQHLFSIL